MQHAIHTTLSLLLLAVSAGQSLAQTPKAAAPPVMATIDTTLATSAGKIRQFAFDGDADSYFLSAKDASAGDHFTLVLDSAVALKSITVTTGRPKGGDLLDAGILEVSDDGKKFEPFAKFAAGVAKAKSDGRRVLALRIKPTADLKHPLAIREIVIDSEPNVVVFKYPVEIVVDVSDAPEMKEWADKVARLCERNYRMINDELPSEGFKPRTVITMTLRRDYKGVAAAGGGKITGSVSYFKSRPNDVGAMIHETVHCVQSYRTRGNPGWLVEGIADYVRFFKYEPGKIGKINNDPHYNGSYRTSAAFLNFVTEKYDKELVRKLNKAMREGEYREEIWKVLTKKTVKELDEEWRMSLKKGATKTATPRVDVVGDSLFPLGPPAFRTHQVPDGWASVIADVLRAVVPRDLPFRASATPPSQILVYTDPYTHDAIRLLVGSDGQRHWLLGALFDFVPWASSKRDD